MWNLRNKTHEQMGKERERERVRERYKSRNRLLIKQINWWLPEGRRLDAMD